MNKKLTILEIAAILLIVILIVVGTLYPKRELNRDQVVVAFGDSLTVGHGTPPGKNYVTYLSEALNIPIINSGKSGDTTADALIRFNEDVADKNPDVVMVLLGGNDLIKNGSSEEYVYTNLKIIIKHIQKIGAKVILIGVTKDVAPLYEAMYEKLAWEMRVDGYVPNILGGIILRKDLMFDEIHPNDRGQEIIAERILPVLKTALVK